MLISLPRCLGLAFALLLLAQSVPLQAEKPLSISGPYLGQPQPGTTAELFAPNILCLGRPENFILFSADGRELLMGIGGAPHSVIVQSREVDGRWSKPVVTTFSGQYGAEATLSPDGQRVALSTGAPVNGGPPTGNWQVWFVDRIGDGWGDPINAGFPPNAPEQSVDYPTITAGGNLYYFSGSIPGGLGGGDIWMSMRTDGKYQEPINLGTGVNSEHWDIDPYLHDERLLVFASNRPGGLGGSDLYVSHRGDDGSWSPARNLGPDVNSGANEIHPFVSLDGRYLFFCSTRTIGDAYSPTALTYEEKMQALDGPGNGAEDIYWVSVRVLD